MRVLVIAASFHKQYISEGSIEIYSSAREDDRLCRASSPSEIHRLHGDVATLDLTRAVRSGPELVTELRVRGGHVKLVLAPGMVVDANELSVRFSNLAISRDAGDSTPETLRVHLTGKYGTAGSTPGGCRSAGDTLAELRGPP
jgi:hypothetical protein